MDNNVSETQVRSVYNELAPKAVSLATENNIILDYSIDSLKSLDLILESLHSEYKSFDDDKTNEIEDSYKGYAEMLGCYILAVADKNKVPGKLTVINDNLGTAYGFTFESGAFSDFASWCYKAIINGKDDAIWPKFVFFSKHEINPKSM